jgi:hypothetical protein
VVNSRKKRRRTRTNQEHPSETRADPRTPHAPRIERRGGPLVIGKLSTTGDINTCSIVAARPLIQKAVFCIDNVDQSVSVEDICSFVSSLSVNVLSCFETKPRRRRNSIPNDNHKAFRLCIAKDDRDRLLDASRWPAYISISDWYFKSSVQQADGRTGTSVGPSNAQSIVPTCHGASADKVITVHNHNSNTNSNAADLELTDMEATIITQNDNINVSLIHT